jgi:Polyketide cyclase / dehydrase and lipid transport
MLESAPTHKGWFFEKMVISVKENGMIRFDLNTYIYRPLKQVFAFVATPENDFHWQYGTLVSAQISKGEIGVGALFRAVGHFMGRRIESVYEVTEFEPNKRYGFRSLSGPMDSHTLYTFEIMEGSTKINISTQINPGDLFKPNDTTAEKAVKKQYRENLALLKDVLEASPTDRPLDETSLVSNRRRSDFR